jgi:hypothetical protein
MVDWNPAGKIALLLWGASSVAVSLLSPLPS